MSALANSKFTLSADVAKAGTVVRPYPAGTVQATLTGSTGGTLAVNGDVFKQGAGGFTVTFGASDITITNDSPVTWPANSEATVSFGRNDINGSFNLTNPRQVQDKVAAL